jgi:hypothetical protein
MPDGSILLMAWHDHKLRKIDPASGHVWVVGGAGPGFAGDGGPVASALFKQPSALAVDEAANIYIVDQQNLRVRRIDGQTRVISSIVGNGTAGAAGDGGPATAAQLNLQLGSNPEPSGGIAYSAGTLYISDTENNRVRKVVLATGVIDTLAGTGGFGYAGDGGPAAQALLAHPRGLAIGPEGDLYVADTENGAIRAIELAGGSIRTVVGTGELGLDGDGRLAIATRLDRPFKVSFDPDGNLYVADTLNSRYLRVAR